MKSWLIVVCLFMVACTATKKDVVQTEAVRDVHPESRRLAVLHQELASFDHDPHFLRHGFSANSPYAGWLEQVLRLQADPLLGEGADLLANLAVSIRLHGHDSRVTQDFSRRFHQILHQGPSRKDPGLTTAVAAETTWPEPDPPLPRRQPREIVVVYSGDTQGVTQAVPGPSGPAGGLDRRTAIVERMRGADPDLLLLDAGDLFFSASRGNMDVVLAMNGMSYDAAGLGVHDVQLGPDVLGQLAANATFALISANLSPAGGDLSWLRPYVVVERGAVRVAVTSVVPRATSVPGMSVHPPLETLARLLPEMRAVADCVILLFQGNVGEVESLLGIPGGIDVVIGDYRQTEEPRYLPASAMGRALGVVRLESVDGMPFQPVKRSTVHLGETRDFSGADR